jgi:hypothetical protein
MDFAALLAVFVFVVNYLLAVFACYRLARLFVKDDGPGDVFLKLRRWAGVYRRGANGKIESSMGRLLECQHCAGLWTAIPVIFLTFGLRPWTQMVLLWLAVAGLQSVLFSWVEAS